MSIKERLLYIIETEKLSMAAFEVRCGLSNGYVRNIKETIGTDKLSTILKTFPNVNWEWLVHGEGEPYIDPASIRIQPNRSNNINSNNTNSFQNVTTVSHEAEIAALTAALERRDQENERLLKMLEHVLYSNPQSKE